MSQFVTGIERAANDIALQVLEVFDYRLVAVLSLVLLLVLIAASSKARGRLPTRDEVVKGVIAILSGFAIIPILCVFLLTEPPAIGKLSEETRALVGVICVVVVAMLSLSELRSVFFRKPILVESAVPAPAPGQTS